MAFFGKYQRCLLGWIATVLLAACATSKPVSSTQKQLYLYHDSPKSKQNLPSNKMLSTAQRNDVDYLGLILAAEQASSGSVRSILAEARRMALFERILIKGSCWDYLDRAWTRAGVPRENRQVVFKSKQKGPFASVSALQPGDWLYHINYSYRNIEHSGMFIGWLDKEKRLGVTLSYAGGNRREPARYRVYDLSGVYQIIRAR